MTALAAPQRRRTFASACTQLAAKWLLVVSALCTLGCGTSGGGGGGTLFQPDAGTRVLVCPTFCDDADFCTKDTCNMVTGQCVYTPIADCSADTSVASTDSQTAAPDAGEATIDTHSGDKDAGSETAAPPPKAGEIVITELHYNPSGNGAVKDSDGEWFEIYNAAAHSITLKGLSIKGPAPETDVFNIIHATVLQPGQYYVLGANSDKKRNGDVFVDVAYGPGIKLNDTGKDGLVIRLDETLIDQVIYDTNAGWPLLDGRSLNLSPDKLSATANDDPKSWCGGRTPMPSGDKGTPGAANSTCDYPDADNDGVADSEDNCKDVANPSQTDKNNNKIGDECEAPAPKLQPGDLLITELMPKSKAGGGDKGEWLEVHNTTAADIDLDGMSLQYKSTVHKIDNLGKPLLCNPGAYVVLGLSADKALNGTAPVDYAYKGIALSNTSGTLSILDGETAIDTLVYKSGKPFPTVTQGASFQLKKAGFTASGNDDGAAWCLSVNPFGTASLKGTPGAANDCN